MEGLLHSESDEDEPFEPGQDLELDAFLKAIATEPISIANTEEEDIPEGIAVGTAEDDVIQEEEDIPDAIPASEWDSFQEAISNMSITGTEPPRDSKGRYRSYQGVEYEYNPETNVLTDPNSYETVGTWQEDHIDFDDEDAFSNHQLYRIGEGATLDTDKLVGDFRESRGEARRPQARRPQGGSNMRFIGIGSRDGAPRIEKKVVEERKVEIDRPRASIWNENAPHIVAERKR